MVLENSQQNVNQTDKLDLNSELVEIITVENTPFTIIRNEEEWYVTIGKYRLTEALKSKEEAEENAKREDWERLMQVIGVMIENYNNDKK